MSKLLSRESTMIQLKIKLWCGSIQQYFTHQENFNKATYPPSHNLHCYSISELLLRQLLFSFMLHLRK